MAIVGYEYRMDGGSWIDVGLPDPLTFTVEELAPGTEYDFEVRGYDAEGNRTSISNIATASTLALDMFDPVWWIRPEEIDGVYTEDEEITVWEDASGNGFDGETTTGPAYNDNQINGYPVAKFRSTGSVFSGSSGPFIGPNENLGTMFGLGVTATEMVVVVRALDETPADGTYCGSWSVAGGSTVKNKYPEVDGDLHENFFSTTCYDMGPPPVDITEWRVYSVYSTDDDWAAYLDGEQLHHADDNVFNASFSTMLLGASNTTTVQPYLPYFNGEIAECLLWPKKLSDPQRTAIWNYLKEKYELSF